MQASRLNHMSATQSPRQLRQKHGGNGDADDTERQLVNPVRIGKRGDHPFTSRSDIGVDQQIDLGNAAGDRGGQGKNQKPLHIFGHPRPAEAYAHAGIAHGDPDDGKLHHPCHHNTPGQGVTHLQRIVILPPRQSENADEDDVEEHRRDRGRKIAVQRVQHAAHHRRQRHAGEIGEHDGREPDGVVEFYRIFQEARCNHGAHDERHRQFHQDRQRQEHGEENTEDLLGKAPCALHAIRLDFLGEKRHEG
ncbi:hypothetical protein D3C72_1078570 [compost metagenome]